MTVNIQLDLENVLQEIRKIMQDETQKVTETILSVSSHHKESPEYLTVKEVLVLLRISRGTLYTLINKGVLQTVKVAGKRLLTKQAIETYINNIESI